MFKIIKNIKEKIEDRKPINIFGDSVFDRMDERTSVKDRFTDMLDLYRRDEKGIKDDKRFIRAIHMLDRLKECYFFKDHLTNSPFGVMLDIDYIDVTDDYGIQVHEAVKFIMTQLSDLVYSNDYCHDDDRNTWITFGYELTYTNQHNHAILVIPYPDQSGYTKLCRMVIPSKHQLH